MPFKKGQSGNPGGRLKAHAHVLEIARGAGPDAINRLIQLIRSKDERVAFHASAEVLNRGFGKPAQAVHLSGADGGPVIFQTFYEPPPEGQHAQQKPGTSPPDAGGRP